MQVSSHELGHGVKCVNCVSFVPVQATTRHCKVNAAFSVQP